MKVGYVRVSTEGQNTARQEELMKELQVERVYPAHTEHFYVFNALIKRFFIYFTPF